MNVVDSSGWLEYFTDRKTAAFFAPAIEDTEKLLVPVVTIYEVFKKFSGNAVKTQPSRSLP
jgi:predicted nucleic acid-binding protein